MSAPRGFPGRNLSRSSGVRTQLLEPARTSAGPGWNRTKLSKRSPPLARGKQPDEPETANIDQNTSETDQQWVAQSCQTRPKRTGSTRIHQERPVTPRGKSPSEPGTHLNRHEAPRTTRMSMGEAYANIQRTRILPTLAPFIAKHGLPAGSVFRRFTRN